MPVPTMSLGLSNKQHSTADEKTRTRREISLCGTGKQRQMKAQDVEHTEKNLPVLQGPF